MIDALPLLLGPEGYQISRSVRFRSSASAYFNRTPATATNQRTWSWSAWVKRGALGTEQMLFEGGIYSGSTEQLRVFFTSTDNLEFNEFSSSAYQFRYVTTAVYRDPSAWYHILAVLDTTNSVGKLYVNGVQVTAFSTSTAPALNFQGKVNSVVAHDIGRRNGIGTPYFDGYLTEINFIDGQALTPSSFGETNAVTGVWQPIKYTGTYGTNGFYLNFSDNSGVTATTIGKDYSGNGNNWTPNNISVTAGTTYDSMLDVPTLYADGGNGRGNYCVLNPLDFNSGTVSNGNLQWVSSAAVGNGCFGTFAFDIADSTNKYYWEMTLTSGDVVFGIVPLTTLPSNTSRTGSYSYYTNGNKYSGTSASAYGSTFTSGDVIGVAVGNGIITFYKNNVSQGSAFTGLTGFFKPAIWEVSGTFNANFGQRPFTYTPPTGFKALNTQNLPAPTISNGAQYMAATLYAANGSTQTISNAVNGISMQPDFVWVKSRQYTTVGHSLFDALRPIGVNSSLPRLVSNSTDAETNNGGLTAFVSNGFSLNNDAYINSTSTGGNMVAWQWNAGGSTVTNTNGSISSQVRANPTAGFSVVTYTGTGANATVGHGLNAIPAMIIVKNRDSGAIGGAVYHTSLGATKYLKLFQTTTGSDNAATDNTAWNGGSPTFNSSVFSVGSLNRTNSSQQMVAYCFAPVAGYSAFGSYTGNGVPDGPFVFLGFRPRFVLFKRTDAANDWVIHDSSRNTFNVVDDFLKPNLSNAEGTYATSGHGVDFLSSGMKLRTDSGQLNASTGTYIYAAFAENPFKNSLAR